jgi:hypothetical protein
MLSVPVPGSPAGGGRLPAGGDGDVGSGDSASRQPTCPGAVTGDVDAYTKSLEAQGKQQQQQQQQQQQTVASKPPADLHVPSLAMLCTTSFVVQPCI